MVEGEGDGGGHREQGRRQSDRGQTKKARWKTRDDSRGVNGFR